MAMNDDSEEVQRLLRLKRYESPAQGYYESFLQDFKERQRSEMLRLSARDLLLERLSMWFEESGGAKRFVPAGALAAATVGVGLYLTATVSTDQASSETYAAGPSQDLAHPLAVETASASLQPSEEEEAIHLSLPRPAVRVPDLADETSIDAKVLSAGVRNGLREL